MVTHQIRYGGRIFENRYVFPAEIAALRARKTGQFQEAVILEWIKKRNLLGAYFDVGAHIGNHTLFFAAFCRATSVVSIEGHPEIRELLRINVERNLGAVELSRVQIIDAAAWSRSDETVRFAPIPRNNAGHTHIANSGGRRGEVHTAESNTIALDDIEFEGRLVVLKIDVEDVEEQVIAGAQRLIEEHKPIIIIERHSKEQLDSALALLERIPYRVTQEWRGAHTFALEPA